MTVHFDSFVFQIELQMYVSCCRCVWHVYADKVKGGTPKKTLSYRKNGIIDSLNTHEFVQKVDPTTITYQNIKNKSKISDGTVSSL